MHFIALFSGTFLFATAVVCAAISAYYGISIIGADFVPVQLAFGMLGASAIAALIFGTIGWELLTKFYPEADDQTRRLGVGLSLILVGCMLCMTGAVVWGDPVATVLVLISFYVVGFGLMQCNYDIEISGV